MILYKTILMAFGHHLANGKSVSMPGHDGRPVSAEDVRRHWQRVVNDISSARMYLLDHNAANYLDSLRTDVQGLPWEDRPESDIQDYVRNIDLPRDLVWVEYDDRLLWEGRIARGLTTKGEDGLAHRYQRGFLYDNRSSDKLTVRLFGAVKDKIFSDAPFALEISKAQDGRPVFTNVSWLPNRVVIAELVRAGFLRDTKMASEWSEVHKGHLSYEMVIGFMLFAALAAREDDLHMQKVPSLSTSQIKTARKFGKGWITETLKSHVTVRIGPAAERHLSEQKARLLFEQGQAASRNSPTIHWVAEHERHYADGKVVRIRAHKRGQSNVRGLPSRVVGPRVRE